MKQKTTEGKDASRVCWESLESWMREQVQAKIQDVLEEEVTEFLGRGKSTRRTLIDAQSGYRAGYSRPRQLTTSAGTITLRRPKVRDTEEKFESRLLPLFARRTPAVDGLLPELYLHGLAQGDMDLALRGLLGEEAPISASTVARLKEKWQGEFEDWSNRRLDDLEVVYLWVDGVYVKAGLEKDKAAILVVVAGLADGSKVVVALEAGHRESQESWAALLRELRKRGLNCPRLVIGDGHLGIWAGLRSVFPEAKEQRCWNHRLINILDKVPKKLQGQATLQLKELPYAKTREEAARLKEKFQGWCRKHSLKDAASLIDHDWDRRVAFYDFPREHWIHLRTSNVIESPFAALRLRTDAAKRYRKVETASAVIFKLLMVAEQKFRRLNAPELLKDVFSGVKFVNGVKTREKHREAAA